MSPYFDSFSTSFLLLILSFPPYSLPRHFSIFLLPLHSPPFLSPIRHIFYDFLSPSCLPIRAILSHLLSPSYIIHLSSLFISLYHPSLSQSCASFFHLPLPSISNLYSSCFITHLYFNPLSLILFYLPSPIFIHLASSPIFISTLCLFLPTSGFILHLSLSSL